jgi:hypothetical protein
MNQDVLTTPFSQLILLADVCIIHSSGPSFFLSSCHFTCSKKLGSKGNAQREKDLFLSRIYHEAPNDIMELIVMLLSTFDDYGRGKGGMNVLRLVSKRLMLVVESCATRLTNQRVKEGPVSFLLF